MGGFLGIGGSSANTDRKNTLQGYADLNNVFNFGLSTAQKGAATGAATTQTGLAGLTNSLNYWQNLLGGSRTAITQAVAPETNAIQAQSDAAQRQQAAMGTARGGGTAAANQQRQTTTQAAIDQGILAARPQAAQQEAAVGGKIADVGTTQMAQALNALGISETAGANLTDISSKARAIDYQINHSAIGDVLNTIGLVGSFFA